LAAERIALAGAERERDRERGEDKPGGPSGHSMVSENRRAGCWLGRARSTLNRRDAPLTMPDTRIVHAFSVN
jgi:hypothetical protein